MMTIPNFDFSEDVETPDTEDSDRPRYKYLSKYQYKYRSVFQKFFLPLRFSAESHGDATYQMW